MQKLRATAARIAGGAVVTCLVLTLPMCTSLPAVSNTYATDEAAATKSQFSDLTKEHWAYGSIYRLAEAGIIAGFPDGRFKPEDTVTYGEYIKMAVMADSDQNMNFVNTDETDDTSSSNGNWAESYYETAQFKKYLTQNRITKKMLNYPISRRDMALIASAVIGKMAIDNYSEIQAGIKDIDPRTPDEYEITKAYASGVLNGYPDGTFKPDRTLTRAEAAISIERLMKVQSRENAILQEIENAHKTVPKPIEGTDLKSIDELIINRNEIPIMKDVKYYWTADTFPYEFEKIRSLLGTEALKILPADPARVVIFIKGDKAYRTNMIGACIYLATGTKDGSNLPDFDWLGFYSRNSDKMMLIKRPYK